MRWHQDEQLVGMPTLADLGVRIGNLPTGPTNSVVDVPGAGLLIGSLTAGRAGVRSEFKLSTGQTLRVVTAPVLLGDAKPEIGRAHV